MNMYEARKELITYKNSDFFMDAPSKEAIALAIAALDVMARVEKYHSSGNHPDGRCVCQCHSRDVETVSERNGCPVCNVGKQRNNTTVRDTKRCEEERV